MPLPEFQPRLPADNRELFERILERVHRELPDALGLAITVHETGHGHDQMTVLAARGFGAAIVHRQLAAHAGPVLDAFAHQIPVLTLDLWSDERWPGLTLAAMLDAEPESAAAWRRVHGSVAVPGVWRDDGAVVLSCTLDRPATAATVTTLIGYEQLVAAALVTATAQTGVAVADMLAVLQSRGAIEQAKGAIMGCLRCDAETAWHELRRASHESNVKLRVLAVALVEHISGAPAEQPAGATPIVPDQAARQAARMLWAVLSHASQSASARAVTPAAGAPPSLESGRRNIR